MTPKMLLTHFDRISDGPDAIPCLRRFILDLAVRGRLVEQDPREETASVLIKRIQAEKARLTKVGKIRKERSLPVVKPDEVPFVIPAQWHWVRIRQVTSDRGQTTPSGDFTYIDVTSINKEVGRVADAKVLSASDAPSRARKRVQTGDVLYSCVRPYLLNIAIIESEIVPAAIASTAFAVLNGFGLVLPRYLWIALRSPFMVECVEAKMRGQAYPAINDADFALLPLPLPPLEEQHRIVAKVDELMAVCDRLEGARGERERWRDRLARASLGRLNDGENGEDFSADVQFYLDHLRPLLVRPEQVSAVRETILSLAVRGQLVRQDQKDETASELIKRIAAENARLQKAKNIRAQKSVSPAENFETKTVIPATWTHAYLQDLAYQITDGTHLTPKYTTEGRPFLSAQNVKPFRFMPEKHRFVSEVDFEKYRSNRKPERCDVLLTRVGAGIGEAAVLDSDFEFAFYVSLCLIKIPTKHFSPEYLVVWLNSPEGRKSSTARTYGKGASQGNLNLALIRTFKIPVPPFAEQRRIVAKVAKLMALCDRLEAQLDVAQNERRGVLEALLKEALEDDEASRCRAPTLSTPPL
jgi:type I restriction enzyme S subunit